MCVLCKAAPDNAYRTFLACDRRMLRKQGSRTESVKSLSTTQSARSSMTRTTELCYSSFNPFTLKESYVERKANEQTIHSMMLWMPQRVKTNIMLKINRCLRAGNDAYPEVMREGSRSVVLVVPFSVSLEYFLLSN